eukprot:Platyproteum_vivax@DN1619_c0_g1_i1.p1
MFKKPLKSTGRNKINKKDKKSLEKTLSSYYSKADYYCKFGSFIPRDAEVTMLKFGKYLTVYQVDEDPWWVLSDSAYFPTVYFLWSQTADTFPQIFIHPETANYIFNGADLMIAGVVDPPDTSNSVFNRDEVCVISVKDLKLNKYCPIAVGTASLSSKELYEANSILSVGKKGKAVNVLHYFGDSLWLEGSTAKRPATMFSLDSSKDAVEEETEIITEETETETGDKKTEEEETGKEETGDGNNETEQSEEVAEGVGDCTLEESGDNDVSGCVDLATETKVPTLTLEQTDMLLQVCLLEALHAYKDTDDASASPLPASALMSRIKYTATYIPKNKLAKEKLMDTGVEKEWFAAEEIWGGCADCKKSSFKKLSAFLNFWSKKNLLSVKEIKHGEYVITKTNRNQLDYKNHKGAPKKEDPQKKTGETEDDDLLEIRELCRVKKNLEPIVSAIIGRPLKKDDYFTKPDLRTTLTSYMETQETGHNLMHADTHVQQLMKVKNGEVSVTKTDFIRQAMNAVEPYYCVQNAGEVQIRKGNPPFLRIETAMASGHKVTNFRNLLLFGLDPSEVAKSLARVLHCSVEPYLDPHSNQTGVRAQGHPKSQPVIACFLNEFKIPKKYIKITETKEKP